MLPERAPLRQFVLTLPFELLQIATTRILRLLRRKGVVEDDAVNADETVAEKEPALAELAVASTLGRVPAGRRRGTLDLH